MGVLLNNLFFIHSGRASMHTSVASREAEDVGCSANAWRRWVSRAVGAMAGSREPQVPRGIGIAKPLLWAGGRLFMGYRGNPTLGTKIREEKKTRRERERALCHHPHTLQPISLQPNLIQLFFTKFDNSLEFCWVLVGSKATHEHGWGERRKTND